MKPTTKFVFGVLTLMAFACSGPSPLKDGLTSELKEKVTRLALEEIEQSETFSPYSFEEAQLKHFERLHGDLLQAGMDHLPTRVQNIKDLEMVQEVLLDENTMEVTWNQQGEDKIRVECSVEADRTWHTLDGQGGARTRYSLPWTLVVENGEVAFYHHGIRSSNL